MVEAYCHRHAKSWGFPPLDLRDISLHQEVAHEQEMYRPAVRSGTRVCQEILKRLRGTSETVKRAQVVLSADADGPGWPDAKIAEAHDPVLVICGASGSRLLCWFRGV